MNTVDLSCLRVAPREARSPNCLVLSPTEIAKALRTSEPAPRPMTAARTTVPATRVSWMAAPTEMPWYMSSDLLVAAETSGEAPVTSARSSSSLW